MTEIRKIVATFAAFALAFCLTPLPALGDEAPAGNDIQDQALNGGTVEGGLPDEAAEAGDQTAASSDGRVAQEAERVDVSALSFVYIESPSVARGLTQNIVVGFQDELLIASAAKLDIVGLDGVVRTLEQGDAVEGAVLFPIDSGILPAGVYELSALRYNTIEGGAFSIDFTQDKEVDYVFRIVEPSDESDLDDAVTTDVYTISSDGEYVEVGSIAEAMAAAGVDPTDGPNEALSTSGELTTQAADGFVIVLDPGHGGYDGGAGGNGLIEKDVNLKIAQYCKAKLEQTPGVTVYMTRSDDTYVSLSDRVSFAANHNADLVVSLHNNAGGGSGSEVIVPRNSSWYYDETYATGHELGEKILGKLNALGLGTHAGVYSRDTTNGSTYDDGSLSDYYALIEGPREEGILGIIVEHAFIDNASDAVYLSSDERLRSLGEADANAIIEYYNSSEGIFRLYWGIYNYDYYTSLYPEVKAGYGSNVQAIGYFKSEGMAAGHRANVLFDVAYYKARYADLQAAFGEDLPRYYQHFMEYGMTEGRQGSADFNPRYYRYAYGDLQVAFGSDWQRYYKHYLTNGMKEGRAAVGEVPESAFTTEAMYRVYNPNSGEHFYTANSYERDHLVGVGWRYEGVGWTAPVSSSTPVYRLYNPNAGDHHYTMHMYERDHLVSVGWRYEGIGWYSDDDQAVTLYRLYNPNAVAGAHHYTVNAYERDHLASVGWRSEGVGWYGVAD